MPDCETDSCHGFAIAPQQFCWRCLDNPERRQHAPIVWRPDPDRLDRHGKPRYKHRRRSMKPRKNP